MAASGRDRGLYSRQWKTGKIMWYVRCMVGEKYQRFGPFESKELARRIYYKMKSLDGLGILIPSGKPQAISEDLPPTMFGECLYFVQCGTGGPIKIGYTKQLGTRLRAIHALNGGTVRFLGAIAGQRLMRSGFMNALLRKEHMESGFN